MSKAMKHGATVDVCTSTPTPNLAAK